MVDGVWGRVLKRLLVDVKLLRASEHLCEYTRTYGRFAHKRRGKVAGTKRYTTSALK